MSLNYVSQRGAGVALLAPLHTSVTGSQILGLESRRHISWFPTFMRFQIQAGARLWLDELHHFHTRSLIAVQG